MIMDQLLIRLVRFIKQRQCDHLCRTGDIVITGIKEIPTPKANDHYDHWVEYYGVYYIQKAITHRVWCPCSKCGKSFYKYYGTEFPKISR